MAQRQSEANLSMMTSMFAARSVSEAVEIQARFAADVMGAATAQWQDLTGAAQSMVGGQIPNAAASLPRKDK